MGGRSQSAQSKPATFGQLNWCNSPTLDLQHFGRMHMFSGTVEAGKQPLTENRIEPKSCVALWWKGKHPNPFGKKKPLPNFNIKTK